MKYPIKIRRKLGISLFLLLPFFASAQEHFSLEGKVGTGNAAAKAFLLYRNGKQTVTDSVELKDGWFKFSGTIQEPTPARLIIDHKGLGFSKTTKDADMMMLYLDKGLVNIQSPDSLKRAKFPGSVINADYNRYKSKIAGISGKLAKIHGDYHNAPESFRTDATNTKEYAAKVDSAERAYRDLQFDFIKANPNSYVSLATVREAAGPIIDVPLIEPIFNSLSATLKNSAAGREFKQMMEDKRRVSIGRQAPVFTQNDQFDRAVSLQDFKGKYVLIDFWASWCKPCRAENPNLVKAYERFKDKNFTVIGVSLDMSGRKADWIKAIKDDGLDWTQVSDLKFWDNAVAKLYGIRSIPQNFLLDKEGKIIAENLRGEALINKLAEVL